MSMFRSRTTGQPIETKAAVAPWATLISGYVVWAIFTFWPAARNAVPVQDQAQLGAVIAAVLTGVATYMAPHTVRLDIPIQPLPRPAEPTAPQPIAPAPQPIAPAPQPIAPAPIPEPGGPVTAERLPVTGGGLAVQTPYAPGGPIQPPAGGGRFA